MTQRDPMSELRSELLDAVGSLDPTAFTKVDEFEDIPGDPYFESRNWADLIFRQGASPHRESNDVSHSYYIAENEADHDLLRHEYKLSGLAVTVTESRVMMHVSLRGFSPSDYGGANTLAQARALAALVLNVSSELRFAWCEVDPKYRFFSSNPQIWISKMKTWTEKIDGIAEREGIVLLCYKIKPNGDSFVDTAAWFPDNFRKATGP